MKVVVQRPSSPKHGVWREHVDFLFDAELRPLGRGWHVLESLEPLGPLTDEKPFPVLHKGYFDAHLHVGWMGLMELDVDLRAFTRPEEIQSALTSRVESGATFIRAYGWDETKLGLSLEQVTDAAKKFLPASIPAILYRVCGHAALASPPLLASAGLEPAKPFVSDRDFRRLADHIPPPTSAELREAFLIGQRKLLDVGVSAVGDMSLDDDAVSAIRDVASSGELKIDVVGVFDGAQALATMKSGPVNVANSMPIGPLDRAAIFSVRHWKRYLDGSFGSRTAWLSRDYSDRPERGHSLVETLPLLGAAREALRSGFHLSFHAIGDAALDQVLEVGERLSDLMRERSRIPDAASTATRHRIEHAQLIRDDQIARLVEQGHWTLCVQPNHRVADEGFSRSRLGPTRLRDEAYRMGTLLDAGLSVAMSSDALVDSPDPEYLLRSACSHENPRERVSFYEAIWRYTTASRLDLGLAPGRIAVGSTVRLTDPAVIL